ncbi:MAG: hypothetical protein J6B50_11925 [Lachnospiraceae bacterium]|nr:hypothetical protein [Lachnospiraceae bacterium]MBP3505720.1 hypothetical protein [Lachnospiraceae bacterium]
MRRKKGKAVTTDIESAVTDIKYRVKCQCAISMVELKLQMIQEELAEETGRKMISHICSRIKSAESIRRKLLKKGYDVDFETAKEKLNDMIGVRATCFFEDDIYEIVKRLSTHKDVTVIKEKDYIKKPKSNGYHSFHLIVEVPVYSDSGCEQKRVEIQFRTVAMDFWAQLDYQLCYKREMSGEQGEDIQKELHHYADEIAKIDKNMMRIRKEIETM